MEGDGHSVPEGACDREYGFVFSASVFIHCPKDVIDANLAAMKVAVAPGGLTRYQLLAELTDPEGLENPDQPAVAQADTDAALEEAEVDLLAPIREAGEEELVQAQILHQFVVS